MTAFPRSMILVLVASLSAMAMTISGTVRYPDGIPCKGVSVALASDGSSTTSNDSGQWMLEGVSVAVRSRSQKLVSHLVVQGGRLRITWDGRDLSGRISGNVSQLGASSAYTARAASTAPDTLIYSFGGRVFLRDTVSQSRRGIIRIYDTTWNNSIIYGWAKDQRSGQEFRSVRIGTMIWMAENLNYRNTIGNSDTVGICYENDPELCSTYGRLYTWAEVMRGEHSSTSIPSGVYGVCPSGWHVPSYWEWDKLVSVVGGEVGAGALLKSSSAWRNVGNHVDTYGFRALPAGSSTKDTFLGPSNVANPFDGINSGCAWWSASEDNRDRAMARGLTIYDEALSNGFGFKTSAYSLRCVKN